MKSINNYIQEALIKKNTKLKKPMSEKEILKYILIVWGFSDVDNYDPSDTSERQCVEGIKVWISTYNIGNIKGAYYGGDNASESYFNALQEHVKKKLGKEALKTFKYKPGLTIDNIDINKNYDNKIKLRGMDIYIVYNSKTIAIITNGRYREARVVEV